MKIIRAIRSTVGLAVRSIFIVGFLLGMLTSIYLIVRKYLRVR